MHRNFLTKFYIVFLFDNTLKVAHKFISSKSYIHGDIKPANILISEKRGRLNAFVGDFGFSESSGGTPIFMSTEGLEKDARIVAKTDLYSFAMTVLFFILPIDLALRLLYVPVVSQSEKFRES